MRAVALLRGVNVGGVRFPMKELAAALVEGDFTDVRTVLASGNVVLGTQGLERVAPDVHAVIEDAFGFDVAVVAVPLDTVRSAVADYPFERTDDRHAYVVFATHGSALDELAAEADGLDPDVERLQPGDGVLFWDVPKGRTLDSAFGKRLGRRVSDGSVTTRNLRTLEKILAGE